MAFQDLAAALDRLTVFNRSALDALNWFDQSKAAIDPALRAQILALPYDRRVFRVPPWPEIFRQDDARHHGMPSAVAEFASLCEHFPDYGFTWVEVPKASVAARADWLEAQSDHKEGGDDPSTGFC